MGKMIYPQSKTADIGLILEGSYPFVQGGVSEWVHQIIQNFKEYSFALLFLGGRPENISDGIRYQLPSNVLHLQVNFLFPEESSPIEAHLEGHSHGFEQIRKMHEKFRNQAQESKNLKCPFSFSLEGINLVDDKQFLYSKKSWEFIVEQYNQYCTDPSFIDYFWTVRNIHQPLWQLTKIINNIPQLKLLHTISTGYAGLLGALLHDHYHYPLILSEHGIYTKERRIDIFQSQIVRDYSLVSSSLMDISYLRELWNRYFEALARVCYAASDPIVSLFNAAHQLQLEDGALESKTMIIPNGVDLIRFMNLRRPLTEKQPIIAFIGRLVPIKDVKNFIRMVALIYNKIPKIQAWIIGSDDEDPEYAKECRALVENLDLSKYIEFKNHQKMEDIFPIISVVVLSSISEGMPLIVLESFAAGIPVVTTDVGACRELVEGQSQEDKALGCAGAVVKISDPLSLAKAVIHLLDHPKQWEEASKTAIQRVEKLYDQNMMISRYRKIYENHLNQNLSSEK